MSTYTKFGKRDIAKKIRRGGYATLTGANRGISKLANIIAFTQPTANAQPSASSENQVIRLSKQHGFNPTLAMCFFCNKPNNTIVLLGRLPEDAKAPHQAVVDHEPCEECKEWMVKGIICISVRDPKSPEEEKNPYRTGGWAVVTEDYIRRSVQPTEQAEVICKKRVCFIPDEAWMALGLPGGPRPPMRKKMGRRKDSTTKKRRK
jgi:hypothetical protein